MQPLIEIRHIAKRFPGVVALDDVSFDVLPGEFHSICGENGAGKSTLMKILSGVLTDYEGDILIDGEPVRFTSTKDAEAAGISIIHQELNLVEELSVAANIFLGRELRSGPFLNERAMNDAAAILFEQLKCPIRPHQKVKELRIGDQQLVEIAKALALKSRILIMDEPTSALTETEVERLFGVIQTLRESGVTILYISHKMEEVFRLSDRITVLRDGKQIRTLNRTETTPLQITHLMVGRELQNLNLAEQRSHGGPVLEVRNLSLPWPGHARQYRLEGISFNLHKGEVLGIAGLMGAGRTELLECLFGANEEPIQGEIFLHGKPVTFTHPADATAAGIAMVTEDRKRLGLFSQMSVKENITLCTLSRSVKGGLISSSREREEAEAGVRELGIKTAGVGAAITSLSGGNQQKCIISRWLKTNPAVLLLDDPTRGIDVGAKAEIYQVIDQLCRQGLSIIVTSSELPELITLADRILVLCEGRLSGELSRSEFTEERLMELATQVPELQT
jgi:ribose transport system ATP-binding protein